MLSPEKLPECLPGDIVQIICDEVNNLDRSNLGAGLKEELKYNTVKCILQSYSFGREYGNLIRMMERNNYMLNFEEGKSLSEDLFQLGKDYSSDSRESSRKKIDEINKAIFLLPFESGFSFNLGDYISDFTKRKDTDRVIKVTYIDKWIMYNKLFSNSK
jgi:hypothetical protein